MKYSFRNRLTCMMLCIVLVMSLLPAAAFAAEEDSVPPVLKGITLSSDSVTAPGSIDVIVDAADDGSGVESVYVEFTCAENGESISCRPALSDDDKFRGEMLVEDGVKAGTYRISFVSLDDGAGNWQEYSIDVSEEFPGMLPMPAAVKNLQVVVTVSETDMTPPVLNNITLSSDAVTAPGRIEVAVDAEDARSEVAKVYVEFVCEETGDTISCKPALSDDDLFRDAISIGANAKSGTYRLSSVKLEDELGNQREYSKDATEESSEIKPLPAKVRDLKFAVSAQASDCIPGAVKSITLSKTSVTAPGSIDVAVELAEGNEDTEYVIISFYCEQTKQKVTGTAEKYYFDDVYQPYPDGKLHGTLTVGTYTDLGTFNLNWLTLGDGEGNAVVFAADPTQTDDALPMPEALKPLRFAVTASANPDSTPPELKSVSVSVNTISESGRIEVIVKASDAVSGVSGADVYFYNEETDTKISCTAFRNYFEEKTNSYGTYPAGELHGVLEISPELPAGVYRLSGVRLGDMAENQVCYDINPSESADPDCRPLPDAVKGVQFSFSKKETSKVTRVFGADRYATSFKAADKLKAELGVSKFQSIVVASGVDFPDALAGSYLAAVKNAPILLVRGVNVGEVKTYIKNNLTAGGTVYLLGGVNAVPKAMGSGLDGFKVKRLGGATRYDTNLLILKEAGVGNKDIIVCTGLNFADSLSASATGLPILLVKDGLLPAQKEFLKGTSGKKIIVGGNVAVNTTVEKQLAAYGQVKRLAGSDRYETSVMVAKEFLSNPTSAVLAYAQNFPDGLSGGPLAYLLNAPLILTDNNKPTAAVNYGTGLGIKSGYVLGGTGLISDKVVKSVFSMAALDSVTAK